MSTHNICFYSTTTPLLHVFSFFSLVIKYISIVLTSFCDFIVFLFFLFFWGEGGVIYIYIYIYIFFFFKEVNLYLYLVSREETSTYMDIKGDNLYLHLVSGTSAAKFKPNSLAETHAEKQSVSSR